MDWVQYDGWETIQKTIFVMPGRLLAVCFFSDQSRFIADQLAKEASNQPGVEVARHDPADASGGRFFRDLGVRAKTQGRCVLAILERGPVAGNNPKLADVSPPIGGVDVVLLVRAADKVSDRWEILVALDRRPTEQVL